MDGRSTDYIIRQLGPDDLPEALNLVWRVFSEFVMPNYTREGVEEFKRFIYHGSIAGRLAKAEQIMWGCYLGGDIAGVISCGPKNHISLLFVDKEYHRRGIAAKLVGKATSHYKGLGYDQIDVNASTYGMPAYQRLGFAATGSEKTVNGICFTPMLLRF
jgi:Acetyltransferases